MFVNMSVCLSAWLAKNRTTPPPFQLCEVRETAILLSFLAIYLSVLQIRLVQIYV